ncbi:hypothetical protein K523DRAFT_357378 [Schizophyllum commune Tattone D]|nr:hypothetical protein K523DRAFT_357378 [Schizophyllum commune Tattone D]
MAGQLFIVRGSVEVTRKVIGAHFVLPLDNNIHDLLDRGGTKGCRGWSLVLHVNGLDWSLFLRLDGLDRRAYFIVNLGGMRVELSPSSGGFRRSRLLVSLLGSERLLAVVVVRDMLIAVAIGYQLVENVLREIVSQVQRGLSLLNINNSI